MHILAYKLPLNIHEKMPGNYVQKDVLILSNDWYNAAKYNKCR